MTYRELQQKLNKFTQEQLDMDATVSLDISEEAIAINYIHIVEEQDFLGDVLDIGHPVFAVDY